MSEQYIIETPENISFGYDVAGIGSRFLAALIDTLIQGFIYSFLFVVYILIDARGARLIDEQPRVGAGGLLVAFIHPSSTGGVLIELTQRAAA